MSERQAKRKRQNAVKEEVIVKKNKADVLTNVVITLIVIALVGLGAWAVIGEYKGTAPEVTPVTTDEIPVSQEDEATDDATAEGAAEATEDTQESSEASE
ncbi:MAG: hypothetical protein IJD30_05410 [Clostridia bacterium]|nr:hypothetical protein [Clostridia bacterium]